MTTIDCPICDGPIVADQTLTSADCDGCGATLDYAPDPVPAAGLPLAA